MISMRVMPAMAVTMPISLLLRFQHRSLLDMQFEKGLRYPDALGSGSLSGIAADLGDALRQGRVHR